MTNNDIFNSKEESIDSKFNRVQSNSRYSHFRQLHFTVGDEDQFDKEISKIDLDLNNFSNNEEDKLNIFNYIQLNNFWDKYKYQEKINVIQTFRYIFYKFKKGIFIQIKNNKVLKFLPCSNANFVNEWSEQINVDYNIFKKVSKLDNRPFNEKSINKFVQNWFSNNCLIRYEYPVNESDTNVSNIKNFFNELCESRKIPDINFFVNKRDFPLLMKNLTEPYYDVWGHDKPLVSHQYDSYLPILSMSKTNDYADILIPTHEDWARVKQEENIWFTDSRINNNNTNERDDSFNNKIPTAVFRGSSTGEGFTIKSNQRLNISYLSSLQKMDPDDGIPYLNCGITKWNTRAKKMCSSPDIQIIDPDSFSFSLVPFMSMDEQRQFKYIVHIDGHVSAFRLSATLKLNSVVLIVESKWKMWYSDLLVPYEHFIPIKSDLSDLYEQIKWCKENNESSEVIANNAREFAENYLCKNGILDYTQKMLIDLKKFMVFSETPLVKSLEKEQESLKLPEKIQDILKNEDKTIIFENKNVTILKCMTSPIIIKKRKKKEDKSCSYALIENLGHYPNFCEIYGYDIDNNMVMEYVDGIKLYDYIADKKLFDFNVYLDILTQISFALHVAQKQNLFVHNDLTPWNIILKEYTTVQNLKYDNFQISSKIVAVIIDFDKSHIIDSNYIHHGQVNGYKFSSIQDIMSLIITSLYQIISNQNLSRFQLSAVIKIANFLTNTKFIPNSFKSIHQLKGYLFSMKKHSSLLYSKKLDLENLDPIDFVFYMRKTIRDYNFTFKGVRSEKTLLLRDQFAMKLLKKEKEFEFDKYTFWSASKVLKVFQSIKALDPKKLNNLQKNINQYDCSHLKKIISNIQTFISLYK